MITQVVNGRVIGVYVRWCKRCNQRFKTYTHASLHCIDCDKSGRFKISDGVKVPKSDIQQIVELRLRGMDYKGIGESIGVSKSVVRKRWLYFQRHAVGRGSARNRLFIKVGDFRVLKDQRLPDGEAYEAIEVGSEKEA